VSAVTVAVLDRRLADVARRLASPGPRHGVTVDYHDALTKAPRTVIVGHLLRTAVRVARRGLAPAVDDERWQLTPAGRLALSDPTVPAGDRIEVAAQLLHERRHRAGHGQVCTPCRDDAAALVAALPDHSPDTTTTTGAP
jgi:hypothetical protein